MSTVWLQDPVLRRQTGLGPKKESRKAFTVFQITCSPQFPALLEALAGLGESITAPAAQSNNDQDTLGARRVTTATAHTTHEDKSLAEDGSRTWERRPGKTREDQGSCSGVLP